MNEAIIALKRKNDQISEKATDEVNNLDNRFKDAITDNERLARLNEELKDDNQRMAKDLEEFLRENEKRKLDFNSMMNELMDTKQK